MTKSVRELKELISSFQSKSTALNKLLPVKLSGSVVLGLVDSSNSFYNAISLSVATKIGLSQYDKYFGPPVGTALVGSTLDIVGVINKIGFGLTDEFGRHVINGRLVIVRQLSCGLNISLPFLVENGLDQLHSQGVLLWTSKHLQFPLFRNMSHARQVASSTPTISAITLGNSTIEVSNKVRQTIPPRTGRVINASIPGKTIVKTPTDTVFSYRNAFLNKINALKVNIEHPSQDDTYFGLNSLDQATAISESNELNVYFFNESDFPLTISSNCIIGSIKVPEPHAKVVDISDVMTIAPSTSPDASWLNNVPSAKLKNSDFMLRKEYVTKVLDAPNSPALQANPDIAAQLVDLIMIFWNVFYREGNCGGTDIIEHPVYTPKGHPPIRLKNRPINPGLIDSLKEQIATWLKDGVIRSGGISPWNFPLLPVRKKNGKWRWVVDFRMLNSVTRKDSFPIPNIVELLSYLRNSKYFTSLDLAQAFHSIPVREVDREKLSFCALDKFYQFCRMPFGLTSAPNTWARLVTKVLQDIPKTQLIVFFDDLLIHSPDLQVHMDTIKQVFMLLRKTGLRLNMEKTDWVKTQVKFLGHLISDQGVTVPPEFSQIIKDWPLPTTLKDLRSFLGKCNYYRSHFQNFAIVAAPLMSHLKGASESSRKLNLIEDPKAIASFKALKELLMSPQLLAYPDFDSPEPFIVDTDYSHDGIGTVLSQIQNGVERPIAFNAR